MMMVVVVVVVVVVMMMMMMMMMMITITHQNYRVNENLIMKHGEEFKKINTLPDFYGITI